jgi:DNA-binding transcriptional regulator LsrR (DeoR family)
MPRSKRQPDRDQFIRVAKLKGEECLTNEEIASELGLPERKITHLIEESFKWLLAEQARLAEIDKRNSVETQLEQDLKARFGRLKRVLIVSAGTIKKELDYAHLVREWAQAGAVYLDGLIDDAARLGEELHVGMAGGETILEVMNRLPDRARLNAYFYASAYIGRAMFNLKSHVDPITNATVAWARSGRLPGHCLYATVSPLDLSAHQDMSEEQRRTDISEQLNELARLPSIERHIKNQTQSLEVVFAGIGMVNPPVDALGLSNRITGAELVKFTTGVDPSSLGEQGAIGDIAYCFFDSNGKGDNERWRFFLTPGYLDTRLCGTQFYRKMVADQKTVIVIEGNYKVPAIYAALKGELFNVWITDEQSARAVLALN